MKYVHFSANCIVVATCIMLAINAYTFRKGVEYFAVVFIALGLQAGMCWGGLRNATVPTLGLGPFA